MGRSAVAPSHQQQVCLLAAVKAALLRSPQLAGLAEVDRRRRPSAAHGVGLTKVRNTSRAT